MTAKALLKASSLATDLFTLGDDLASMVEARDQVLRAAQVAETLGDDAADEAEEVFGSTVNIHHKSNHLAPIGPKPMFYYSS